MFTTVILWVIAIGWLVANGLWAQKRSVLHARWRRAWAWALAGGCAGAAVAVLVGGTGPVGAMPGAVVAWVVSTLIGRRRNQGQPPAP